MKAVDQRIIGLGSVPLGDCFRACVASIFELDLDEVPHFVQRDYEKQARMMANPDPAYGGWWQEVNLWASDFGLGANCVRYDPADKPRNWHPGWWIATVRSVYMGGAHAVVMWGDELRHDPNPVSRQKHADGIPYEFIGENWFELYDPKQFVRCLDYHVIRELMAFSA